MTAYHLADYLAVSVLFTAAVTAAVVWVLWRRWTVLELPRRLQRSRAAVTRPLAVVTIHPQQVSAPPRRRALPASARETPDQ